MKALATSMHVERRAERGGDAPFLFVLFAAAQDEIPANLDPALRAMLLRHQFAGQEATYRANHPGGRFEIVEVQGAQVGRVITGLPGDALPLIEVSLLPERRGRGIGTSLLRDLQGEARSAGVPMRLSVLHTNLDARRLYEGLGFKRSGATETHLRMQWTP